MKLYQQYLVLAGSKQFGKAHPILTEQMLPRIAEIDEATEVLATSDETQTVATNRIGQNVENAAKSTPQIPRTLAAWQRRRETPAGARLRVRVPRRQ